VDAGSSQTQLAVQQQLAALDAATTRLASAQSALSHAEAAERATERTHQQAQELAETARKRADTATTVAKASAAQFLLALRGDARQTGPLNALDGGGTLLQRLGSLTRVNQLNQAPTDVAARAEADAKSAMALNALARRAEAAVRAVPLATAEAAVISARSAVTAAQADLREAKAALGSGVAFGALPGFRADGLLSGTAWTDPVLGPITDVYGPRPSRPAGTALFHPGVDIGASCGSVIVAAAAGTVSAAGPNGGYGNWVLIDHGDGVQTGYAHIATGTIMVHVGQHVAAGQPIAQVGDTGESTGCHLHVEVRINGSPIDPTPFFSARGVVLGR